MYAYINACKNAYILVLVLHACINIYKGNLHSPAYIHTNILPVHTTYLHVSCT